jgi:predicted metalloprotease with PDZ domain
MGRSATTKGDGGLALDLEVRIRTDGRVSLDYIMRVLWETQGREPGHGIQEGAFEDLAAEVSGVDLAEFFRTSLRSTVDPPVGILLAQFGVRLNLRAAEGASDAGGTAGERASRPRPWLGLRTRPAQGRLRVTHVADGGPGQDAGLAAVDEIVALQGIRADPDSFDSLLDLLTIGRPVEIHVFRRDELLRLSVIATDPPRDTCYLTLDEQASEPALARRQQWLAAPRA